MIGGFLTFKNVLRIAAAYWLLLLSFISCLNRSEVQSICLELTGMEAASIAVPCAIAEMTALHTTRRPDLADPGQQSPKSQDKGARVCDYTVGRYVTLSIIEFCPPQGFEFYEGLTNAASASLCPSTKTFDLTPSSFFLGKSSLFFPGQSR
jgi:hypothetical protein